MSRDDSNLLAHTDCCIKWLRWAAGGSTCSPRWHRGTKQIWRWRWKCRAATACPRIDCPAPASCWCGCRTGGRRASSAAGTRSWCTPAKRQTRGLSHGHGGQTLCLLHHGRARANVCGGMHDAGRRRVLLCVWQGLFGLGKIVSVCTNTALAEFILYQDCSLKRPRKEFLPWTKNKCFCRGPNLLFVADL